MDFSTLLSMTIFPFSSFCGIYSSWPTIPQSRLSTAPSSQGLPHSLPHLFFPQSTFLHILLFEARDRGFQDGAFSQEPLHNVKLAPFKNAGNVGEHHCPSMGTQLATSVSVLHTTRHSCQPSRRWLAAILLRSRPGPLSQTQKS